MIRTTEVAVEGANDEDLLVRRPRRSDEVTVKWPCGDTRTFDKADIGPLVNNIDALAGYENVWMAGSDKNGSGFQVQVVSGELYADNLGVVDRTEGRHFSWDKLKKALKQAAK